VLFVLAFSTLQSVHASRGTDFNLSLMGSSWLGFYGRMPLLAAH